MFSILFRFFFFLLLLLSAYAVCKLCLGTYKWLSKKKLKMIKFCETKGKKVQQTQSSLDPQHEFIIYFASCFLFLLFLLFSSITAMSVHSEAEMKILKQDMCMVKQLVQKAVFILYSCFTHTHTHIHTLVSSSSSSTSTSSFFSTKHE